MQQQQPETRVEVYGTQCITRYLPLTKALRQRWRELMYVGASESRRRLHASLSQRGETERFCSLLGLNSAPNRWGGAFACKNPCRRHRCLRQPTSFRKTRWKRRTWYRHLLYVRVRALQKCPTREKTQRKKSRAEMKGRCSVGYAPGLVKRASRHHDNRKASESQVQHYVMESLRISCLSQCSVPLFN